MPPRFTTPHPLRSWLSVLAVLFCAVHGVAVVHADSVTITASQANPAFAEQHVIGESLTVKLKSTPTTVSYQWFHHDTPLAGATGTSVTFSSLTAADAGNYRLRVTAGSTTLLSNTIVLNVVPAAASLLDPAYNYVVPAGATARLVGASNAGAVIVATQVSGSPPEIFRVRADGSRDPAFALPATVDRNGFYVLGTFPDGGLLISGAPYRLNVDGSAGTLALPAGLPVGTGFSSGAIQANGSFLLATGDTLTRFKPDGSVDATFTYTKPANVDNPTPPSASVARISNIETDSLNRVYVSYTLQPPPPAHSPFRMQLVTLRLSPTGAEDRNFQRQVGEWSFSPSGQVYALADGRVLRSGFGAAWVLLNDDGTVNANWSSAVYGSGVVDRLRNRLFVADSRPDDVRKLAGYSIVTGGLTQNLSTTEIVPNSGDLVLASDGSLIVSGARGAGSGRYTGIARVRTDVLQTVPPRVATLWSIDANPNYARGHDSPRFTSQVYGTGPFTFQWLALDGQPPPPASTAPDVTIPDLKLTDLGRYQLRVTNAQGDSALSNVLELSLRSVPYLANLSGRAKVGVGEDSAIAGVVVNEAMTVLLRGAGPALNAFGVLNPLPNPVLTLYDSLRVAKLTNDNWGTGYPASADAYYGAFPFAAGSLDAGATGTLLPGPYSMTSSDPSGAVGVELVEIYAPPGLNETTPLANLSFRARTEPGENTAIAGLVVTDPQNFDRPLKVLLRAIGPTLADKGVTRPLADSILTVYDAKGAIVARNDDWGVANTSATPVVLAAAMKQVGAFDLVETSKDSALLLDLPPGAYSIHGTGGSGVVLLEVYVVK